MGSRTRSRALTMSVVAGLLSIAAACVPGTPTSTAAPAGPGRALGEPTEATPEQAGEATPTTGEPADAASNLDVPAAELLPGDITAARPVHVVTTATDPSGRPVVTTRKATDRARATALVAEAQARPDAVGVELAEPVRLAAVDPYFGTVWPLTKLAARTAWQVEDGTGVMVAVLDTGVDASHPDLAAAVLPGKDFVVTGGDGHDDTHGHGTHVAGTIAAARDNGIGIAGLAPGAKILPGRVIDGRGNGTTAELAAAIVWAADKGADVINMSLGYRSRSKAVGTAIAYARAGGVVVIAAAGNTRTTGSPTTYPAADAGVMAVAATDSADRDAGFSNQGRYVDLAAPGVGIHSTLPGNRYAYYQGTSMAAPYVAAAAALLLAAAPHLTPDGVQGALAATAVDLGAKGRDTSFGYGRIAPVAALAKVVAAMNGMVTPTVSSTASSGTVAYGTVVTTAFSVRGGGKLWAAKPASVCVAEPPSTAYRCAATITTPSGAVRHTRTVTGPYSVKVVVTATTGSRAAASQVYSYQVRAVAALRRSASRTVRATVTGAVGQTVTVQRQAGQGWEPVTSYQATAPTKIVGGLTSGAVYRISVAAGTHIAGTVSGTVRL